MLQQSSQPGLLLFRLFGIFLFLFLRGVLAQFLLVLQDLGEAEVARFDVIGIGADAERDVFRLNILVPHVPQAVVEEGLGTVLFLLAPCWFLLHL